MTMHHCNGYGVKKADPKQNFLAPSGFCFDGMQIRSLAGLS